MSDSTVWIPSKPGFYAKLKQELTHAAPGTTIMLDGGCYDFPREEAFREEYYPSNNDGSVKSIGILLKNKKYITINGNGASLLFHDNMSPIVVDSCEDITLQNFSVDYDFPQHAEGEIVSSDAAGFTLKVTSENRMFLNEAGHFCIEEENGVRELYGDSCLFGMEFDTERHTPASNANHMFINLDPSSPRNRPDWTPMCTAPRMLSDTCIRFDYTPENRYGYQPQAGNHVVFICKSRRDSVCFVTDSRDIRLTDIDVYRSPSMGVIAQLTENILLNRVRMGVKPGRADYLSLNADATHFVHCTGEVRMTNCSFYNMLDDATNIHGIYAAITAVDGCHLTVKLGHCQQRGVLFIHPGDAIEVLKKGNLKLLAKPTVITSSLSEDKTEIMLTLDQSLDGIADVGDITDNPDRMPSVYLADTSSGRNRPRGFLLTTPKPVVVERCLFENSAYAIHITSDANEWFEAGRVYDVTIRDNIFRGCCHANGPAAIMIEPSFNQPGVYVHHNIRILNNRLETFGPGLIYAASTDGITLEGNTVVPYDLFPISAEKSPLFRFNNCTNVSIKS